MSVYVCVGVCGVIACERKREREREMDMMYTVHLLKVCRSIENVVLINSKAVDFPKQFKVQILYCFVVI